MAIHSRPTAFRRGSPQVTAPYRMPAPIRGIDDRVPIAQGSLQHCTYTYNFVPNSGGAQLRKGFREYQIDVETTTSLAVRTMMPFDGVADDGSEDALFAVTNEGIFDVTTAGGSPTAKVAFASTANDAGYGVFATYVTDAGTKVMFYADAENGLFKYDVATTTWAAATGITGPTIADIIFVAVHKERIWLIEKNSTDAWYLGVGAVTGAATQFFFGSKFKHGGSLRGIFTWSVDGGSGVDDMFVAVSAAGDVMVYQGSDPGAAATWAIKGNYFIGNLPKGSKFGTEEGGELYLLSTYGLIGMNDLLKGVSIVSAAESAVTGKIAALIRARMLTESDDDGWAVNTIPSEGGILISSPIPAGTRPIQYYYNFQVDGWGFWRDLRVFSFSTFKNAVVFGDDSNRVLYMDKEPDEVKLTPPAGFNGKAIEFSMLTSFSALDRPTQFKRVHYIRPDFVGLAKPNFNAVPRFDYESIEASSPVAAAAPSVSVWDTDTWDSAVWDTTTDKGFNRAHGGFGTGRYMAVAMRGFSYTALTLVGWDILYDSGGPML